MFKQSARLQASRLGVGVLLCSLTWSLGVNAQPNPLPDTIARVKPSVVIVGAFNPTSSPRFSLRGTGFVVGSGNWVVSNAHVLGKEATAIPNEQLVVQVRTGPSSFQTRRALVLEEDRAHDLVLLQIEGPAVPALKLGQSAQVREGDEMAFMGFPIGGALGFSTVTHRAMVSSITDSRLPSARSQQLTQESVRQLRDGAFQLFQLDAIAYPGNSGGPLFDQVTGEVKGVMNMVALKAGRESALTQPSGISYAIPVQHVHDLLARKRP